MKYDITPVKFRTGLYEHTYTLVDSTGRRAWYVRSGNHAPAIVSRDADARWRCDCPHHEPNLCEHIGAVYGQWIAMEKMDKEREERLAAERAIQPQELTFVTKPRRKIVLESE